MLICCSCCCRSVLATEEREMTCVPRKKKVHGGKRHSLLSSRFNALLGTCSKLARTQRTRRPQTPRVIRFNFVATHLRGCVEASVCTAILLASCLCMSSCSCTMDFGSLWLCPFFIFHMSGGQVSYAMTHVRHVISGSEDSTQLCIQLGLSRHSGLRISQENLKRIVTQPVGLN